MDVIEDINSDEISRIFKEKSCERQEKQCFWSKKYLKKKRNCPAGEMVTAVHLLVGMINQTFYI